MPAQDINIRGIGEHTKAPFGAQQIVCWDAPQEVPEPRLGNDLVRRKDPHAVDLGGGLRLGGQVAANDLVFLERHLETSTENERTVRHPKRERSIQRRSQPVLHSFGVDVMHRGPQRHTRATSTHFERETGLPLSVGVGVVVGGLGALDSRRRSGNRVC